MTTVFLPWRGEFGQMLMTHVRWVHGSPGDHKVVCCRPGDEPLFPSAHEFHYVGNDVPDEKKNTKFLRSPENQGYQDALVLELSQKYPGAQFRVPLDGQKPQRFPWCPEFNFVPLPRYGAPPVLPEVLVAPRYRKHGEHRNYPHWPQVAGDLRDLGVSMGVLGVPETSVDLAVPRGYRAWDYEDNLGVTLHWMKGARVVLATDSGIAHLAVLAGAPLLVLYETPGVEVGKEEWPWLLPHMKAHARGYCEPLLRSWSTPSVVREAIEGLVKNGGSTNISATGRTTPTPT